MVAAKFGREEEEMRKNSGSAADCRSCVYMTSRVRSYTRHTKTHQSVCFSKCFSHQQLEFQQFSAISNTPSGCNPSCFPQSAAFFFIVSSESHPETKGKKSSDRVQCMDCGQGCMQRETAIVMRRLACAYSSFLQAQKHDSRRTVVVVRSDETKLIRISTKDLE
jgi:hypothetical protein